MKDTLIVEVNGDYYIADEDGKSFFCRACLAELPLKDRSKEDWRYCVPCAHFLRTEYQGIADGRGVRLEALYKPITGDNHSGENLRHLATLPDDRVQNLRHPQRRPGGRGPEKMALPAALKQFLLGRLVEACEPW